MRESEGKKSGGKKLFPAFVKPRKWGQIGRFSGVNHNHSQGF